MPIRKTRSVVSATPFGGRTISEPYNNDDSYVFWLV
jgi:hypothetical protein